MHELIPHQLHLTHQQLAKIVKGQGVNVPVSQMGSDKGDVVVMLHPHNARKMLDAYKRNKGMRLGLSPVELEASMTEGRGFGRFMKKVGRKIKHGLSDAGKAIGKVAKPVGSSLIHAGIPAVLGVAGDVLGGPAGGVAGAVLGDLASKELGEATGLGLYGGGLYGGGLTPEQARKHYMHLIRSMRGMSEEEKAKIRGSGLFRTLRKIGITKKGIVKGLKTIGNNALKLGSAAIGTAIGSFTGNPMLGASLASSIDRAGEKALDTLEPGKYGVQMRAGEALSGLKKDMKDLAKVELQRVIAEKVPVDLQDMAQEVVAGVPIKQAIKDEMHRRGVVSDISLGEGVKRGRGRPRKNVMGAGAPQSVAYQRALSANFSGLKLNNIVSDNAPVGNYKINPVVRPSSDEMTLSPYQSTSSPAMNPFIPTYYTQMGGTQSGYGGRGM